MANDDNHTPVKANSEATPVREPFALTPEQRNTGALLERLLGAALAERYVDFLKLAAGATDLRVTIPLAGHALREIESSIRDTLVGSLDVNTEEYDSDGTRAGQVIAALSPLGYDQDALDRAIKALKPKTSHGTEIRKIAERLGLAPDGDIANAWVTLSRTADQAHKRDFHHSLQVDADFRKDFQKPFELVVRGIMVALEPRFSAMTKRAEALAAMEPVSRAVKVFKSEIPGSLPLQWHFYQVLNTPRWLPFLIERGLTGAPVHESALGMTFRQWPIGFYLLRMAKLHDGSTPPLVVKALRTVAASTHRDVRQQGFDIVAALPSADAATVADIVVGWLTPDIRNAFLDAPQKTVRILAEGGELDAALSIARAIYQLVDEGGSLATLHSQNMYEFYLPGTVTALSAVDAARSLNLFAELLMSGVTINRRYLPEEGQDYTHHTPHPIVGNDMRTYEPYDALILAVRDCALAAVEQKPSHADTIVSSLYARGPRIFKRLALHVLSRHAAASPALCAFYLSDPSLIGEAWCADEYAELALAWFPSLAASVQQAILAHIDSMPDEYRSRWAERFEEHEKHPPGADDVRIYEGSVFRDAVWKWRDALPADRKAKLEEIVREVGDPDAWHKRLFPTATSPLSGADFSARPLPEIVNFLATWQPPSGPQKQTITALAQQLREAVDQEPLRFAEHADRFAELKPIYVRRLLEGLESSVRNKGELPWPPTLTLMELVIARVDANGGENKNLEGDDPDWLWACTTMAGILRLTLGKGSEGIEHAYAGRVLALIFALLRIAPTTPETTDFERQFEQHTYFSAEQTLRGRAIELCIMYLFWESKQPGSPLHQNPGAAMALQHDIRSALNTQLDDRSPDGRVPRAVLGRWMQWLVYFAKDWLTEHIDLLFPPDDDGLRLAAWRAHLLSDGGPVRQLLPLLIKNYQEEIARMAAERAGGQQQGNSDSEHRDNRLGEYLLIIYLGGEAPDDLMQAFWRAAPGRTRQHVIWFLGSHLQLPAGELLDDVRARGMAYWDTRLSAGLKASDKDPYRKELGSITSWCRHINIPTDWLLEQMLKMLEGGFAPNSGYTVVEWLEKVAADDPARSMQILGLLLRNPHTEHWTYTTHKNSIRAILAAALSSGNSESVAQAEAAIGYLASIGEGEYQNLLPPSNPTKQ